MSTDRVLRMVILGRQGSGKGTQSVRVSETYGCVHVSTGEMLRTAVSAGTELGRRADLIMKAGDLVGDDIMNGIVAERLSCQDIVNRGVLLDGFPRTAEQGDALAAILDDLDHSLTLAVNIEVGVAEVARRMSERGRDDDTSEAIAQRLALYEQQTAPLLDWFSDRRMLETVDGMGSEAEVFERLRDVIDRRLGGD